MRPEFWHSICGVLAVGISACVLMSCSTAGAVAENQSESAVAATAPASADEDASSTAEGNDSAPTPAAESCPKGGFFSVGDSKVWRIPGEDALVFVSGMSIDADGAPDTYYPDGIGTDLLANPGDRETGGLW